MSIATERKLFMDSSQISKSIAMFIVAFITAGWILSEDVNYSSNITVEPEQIRQGSFYSTPNGFNTYFNFLFMK